MDKMKSKQGAFAPKTHTEIKTLEFLCILWMAYFNVRMVNLEICIGQ